MQRRRVFILGGLASTTARLFFAAVALAVLSGAAAGVAVAQGTVVQPSAPIAAVPGFWDPRRRPDRPDTSRLTLIRFLTETDYPPFNYAGPDGNPTGFNVDLARAICDELKISCTIQMRRFDTLVPALS